MLCPGFDDTPMRKINLIQSKRTKRVRRKPKITSVEVIIKKKEDILITNKKKV